MLKIGFVSDVHYSAADSGTRACSQGISLLKETLAYFAYRNVDIILDGGDLILGVSHDQDLTEMGAVRDCYISQFIPHQHVPGNHDVINLTIAEMETLFGSGSFTSRSMDLNGFHFVFFCPIAYTGPFTFTSDQLTWLTNDLAGTTLPTIIMTHVPINAGSLQGNGYFGPGDAADGNGQWTNADAARAIISSSTTFLVLQGHTHWNAYHVENDIHYLTLPSLTEMRRTMPDPSASSSIIEIGDFSITHKVRGRDDLIMKLKRRVGEAVWS